MRNGTTQPLKAIIAARGLRNTDIARELGVSAAYIGQCANGHSSPSDDLTRRLAALLDVDPAALFYDTTSQVDTVVVEFVRRTTAASGVPERLEDPSVAESVARVLGGA